MIILSGEIKVVDWMSGRALISSLLRSPRFYRRIPNGVGDGTCAESREAPVKSITTPKFQILELALSVTF